MGKISLLVSMSLRLQSHERKILFRNEIVRKTSKNKNQHEYNFFQNFFNFFLSKYLYHLD